MSSGLDKAIKDFIQIIREAGNKGTSPLDAQAEVLRIDEDGTAWVHLPGGVDETPVKLTINAEVGDKVYVRLSGGRAWITGNQTAPPTDDKTAVVAKSLANIAGNRAKTAQKVADEAQVAANSALKGTKENAAQMAQMMIDFNGDIENLQDQIDGNIATWFYDVDPAMNLPPVTDWGTDEKKDAHLGDIYYNTVKGYAWRFMKSGSTYSWERITDTDVTKALADAAKAQDTADSKRRVFYNTPTVPYDAGDLWVQGSGGDILRCAQAKTSTGSYDRNDWVLASKYTDDSALTTWIEGDFATTIQGLEDGLADAKVETYYQTTDPSTGWSDTQKSEHKGDLWYNSTASVQKYYRWSGTAWQELTATPPQAVFDSIDKKATIYTGTTTPTNPDSGDLWFKGADEPILTYVNNSWVEYNKYTDDSAVNNLEIGGRNLLLDSSFTDVNKWFLDGADYPADLRMTHSADGGKVEIINTVTSHNLGAYMWVNNNNNYAFLSTELKKHIQGGVWLTISSDIKINFDTDGQDYLSFDFRPIDSYSVKGYVRAYFPQSMPKNTWVRIKGSVYVDEITDVIIGRNLLAIGLRSAAGRTAGSIIEYRNVKLEIGNKATDWTPAPEDIDEGIKDASKVATNFLGYDSTNGLIIGNKTSGSWSGYRSQILPGSFNVLDESSTVLASFGPTTVIGEEANANIHLTFNNFSMLNKENSAIFEVGDLRDASGVATLLFYSKLHTGSNGVVTIDLHVNINSIVSVVVTGATISSSEYSFDGSCITITGLEKYVYKTFEITYTTLSSIPYLTFGTRNNSGKIGYFSSVEGDNLIARGFASHAEGSCSKSTADFSHSEGYNTQADGIYSHAEGNSTVANGDASHAEGKETKTFYAYSHAEGQLSYARGQCSHAEGFNTIAYAYMAHSEGDNTEAHGNESHAEGNHTYAGGKCSHAEGYYTIAGSDYQHVSGKYNEADNNDLYAFIIGNGTSEGEESNAFAVSWDGNVFMNLRDCTITDSGTALSVTYGASTLDGLLAQAIINTSSYADAKEILKKKGSNVNMNVKKLLQKILERK